MQSNKLWKIFVVCIGNCDVTSIEIWPHQFVSMFKQFFINPQQPLSTLHPIYLRFTDLAHKCNSCSWSYTKNSFTSKYTNTTWTKLRERPHIASSDRGERGFQNDNGVKNINLKFWLRNMWMLPSYNRCYRYCATLKRLSNKVNSVIIYCYEFLQYCVAVRSTKSIACLRMCKKILWFKSSWLS